MVGIPPAPRRDSRNRVVNPSLFFLFVFPTEPQGRGKCSCCSDDVAAVKVWQLAISCGVGSKVILALQKRSLDVCRQTPLRKPLSLLGEQKETSLGLKPTVFSLWSWHICLQSNIQSATSHKVQPAWTVLQEP